MKSFTRDANSLDRKLDRLQRTLDEVIALTSIRSDTGNFAGQPAGQARELGHQINFGLTFGRGQPDASGDEAEYRSPRAETEDRLRAINAANRKHWSQPR